MHAYHEFATELVSDVCTSIWLCDYSGASLTGQDSASLTDKILSSGLTGVPCIPVLLSLPMGNRYI